ncbi:unnamed protein product [Durusdinium trenchii]|uniref:Chaperone protein DnaJ n=2 Tax=Durusdinium trenchii TaxID=1381693 RepID=A0ABP0J2L1_9DINO
MSELPKVVSFLKLQERQRPLSDALHDLFESEKSTEPPAPPALSGVPHFQTKGGTPHGAPPSFKIGPMFGRKEEEAASSAQCARRSSWLKPSKIEENAAYHALMKAVREGNDFQVQEVLQVACSEDLLQRKDADGHTVLHLAAKFSAAESNASILSYLLHCEADPEARNLLGETPLILAVREALDGKEDPQWLGLVSCLLEGRADPNAADDLNEETPLMEAACHGNQEMCQLLLRFNADVSKKAATGATAADFAASESCEGHQKVLKTLQHLSEQADRRTRRVPRTGPEASFQAAEGAPFATAMGFNTWSGGLSDRWQAPKSAKAADSNDGKEQREDSTSAPGPQFPDFTPLIFGAQTPFFHSNAFEHGYRNGRAERYPFEERYTPQPVRHKARHEKHFVTLGLSCEASAEEVRAAYRKLAKQFHPDKNQGSKEAAERFREVRKAYEQLSAGT